MSNRFHACASMVPAALLSLAAHAHAQSGLPPAARILEVRVVDHTGQVLEENPSGLPLQPGHEYDAARTRDALRWLYATGRYADIRAEAAESPAGVRLDFVVRRNYYVNLVRVSGLRAPPTESWALAALRLGLGTTFREAELEEALERLRQTLAEEGLYQAEVRRELEADEDTRQMDIQVTVVPGPRARAGAIRLENQTPYPDAELLRRSKLEAGQEVTSARLERAGERVRKFLVDRGHLAARVVFHRGAYDAATNTLPLEMSVVAAPRVRVEVVGVRISRSALRRLLPIYEEGAVDEDLLQEGRRDIRDYLEADGYFDSEVTFTVEVDAEKGEQVITYTVERGPRRRLAGIGLEGNRYFGDDLIRARLRLQPALRFAPGRFSRRMMEDDAAAIRALYQANGFRQAEVRAELLEDYAGRPGDLYVRFHINEGEQTTVASLAIEGNRTLSDDHLLGNVNSTENQPYSEFNVAWDRDNILALYFDEGFREARFEAEVTPAGDARRVHLVYRITEGPQIRVDRLLLDGYHFTRRGVIAREVQLAEGQPLREGGVLETQRRLYNLGIFSRVSIAPQNPEGTDPYKNVVVLVEESRRYTIAYGGGVEVQRLGGAGEDPVGGQVRASPRGIFEITKANFGGRPHTLSFKSRASTLQGRALVSYTAPKFLARETLSLLLTGFADKTRDVRTFTSTRYEGSVQLAQDFPPFTSMLYRYSYRRVLVDPASLRVAPDRIPLFSQPTKISALGASWVREQRDNPADATRGAFNTVDLSLAARALGSSATFFRFFAQNSTFHRLSARRNIVFARSIRLGIQEPIGSTSSLDIPLPERFFAGGGQSLRGFGLNQAGPRDPQTGFPIGGQALLVLNQELRFPLRLPKMGGRAGGAIFYDLGNVFARFERLNFRPSVPRPVFDPMAPNQCVANCTNELDYMSHTIGFGFRYATPIGPVRVDLGYQLNPQPFLVPDGNGGLQLARLPRFQIFFNIGSIF